MENSAITQKFIEYRPNLSQSTIIKISSVLLKNLDELKLLKKIISWINLCKIRLNDMDKHKIMGLRLKRLMKFRNVNDICMSHNIDWKDDEMQIFNIAVISLLYVKLVEDPNIKLEAINQFLHVTNSSTLINQLLIFNVARTLNKRLLQKLPRDAVVNKYLEQHSLIWVHLIEPVPSFEELLRNLRTRCC